MGVPPLISSPASPASAARPEIGVLTVLCAGRTLKMHPEGVLFEPATGTAYVADTHFGKSASYRHLGVPVPDGGAVADTAVLSRVLERTTAVRLVILGDFLHDAAARSPETMAALAAWRARHAGLEVVLVRGNHDARAGDPPASWSIRGESEPWDDAGIECRHHPPELACASGPDDGPLVLAGHLHPVVVLQHRRRGRGRERCRCFHLSPRGLVLPAFGSFTGGMVVRPRRGERVFALGPGVVLEVPVG